MCRRFRRRLRRQLPWFIVMGVLCGGVSAVFLKFLRAAKEQFNRFQLPVYVRLTLAGLAVGLVAAAGFPGVCGNGYFVTNAILHGDYRGRHRRRSRNWAGCFSPNCWPPPSRSARARSAACSRPRCFWARMRARCSAWRCIISAARPGVPSGAFALVGMGATLAGTTQIAAAGDDHGV